MLWMSNIRVQSEPVPRFPQSAKSPLLTAKWCMGTETSILSGGESRMPVEFAFFWLCLAQRIPLAMASGVADVTHRALARGAYSTK